MDTWQRSRITYCESLLGYIINKHVLCILFMFNCDTLPRNLDILVTYGCEEKEKWEGGLSLISKGFWICVFPGRFWSKAVSCGSWRLETKMTGIHWRNFVFLCLTDLLIIFSLNTLAFVLRSWDFRGILKYQNLLGFEVLISFPDTKSPAVPTHWAFGSTGNEGFRVVFKFCSATSPWYHLEPLSWPLCTSITLLIRGNNDQGETELQSVQWQVISGSIEKWGAPMLDCLFCQILFFLYSCHYLNSFIYQVDFSPPFHTVNIIVHIETIIS